MLTFQEYLQEGVNDPAIFKAVFLAGGPGSGKSFIVGKTALGALGFRLINSDPAFEAGLKKAGLEATPEDIFTDKGQEVRAKAKLLTKKQLEFSLKGRLGVTPMAPTLKVLRSRFIRELGHGLKKLRQHLKQKRGWSPKNVKNRKKIKKNFTFS
jgi:hypothetical protein